MNQQYPRFGTQVFGENKLIGDYVVDMKKLLGKGTFGEVYECWHNQKPQVKYACKIIPLYKLQQEQLKQTLEEGRLLILAQGNYIVPMITFIRSKKNFYYITQLCNQGNLQQFISKNRANLNEGFILNIFKMICVGYYEQIFKKNLIHRDIKPENILIHDGIPLIADFGFAKSLEDNEASIEQTYKCSPMYASPQVFIMDEGCTYNYKTDIFSLGVLLYQMIYQYAPGQPQTKSDIINFLKKLREKGTSYIDFPKNHFFQVSYETKQAIKSMMEYYEDNRISIEELLNHKMFNLIEMEDNNQYQADDEISQSIYKSLIGQKRRGLQVTKIQSINPVFPTQNQNLQEKTIEEVDKYYLFIRNVAIFSKVTLSNLYHIYQEFKSIGILEINLDYILMALSFHYKLALQFCLETIDQKAPNNVPYNSLYNLSNQYQYTKSLIAQEYEEAKSQSEFLRSKIIQKINSNYKINYQNNPQLLLQVQELSKFLQENQTLSSVVAAYKNFMKKNIISQIKLILQNLSIKLQQHKTFLQIVLSLCLIHSKAMAINQYNQLKFNEFYQQFGLPNEHIIKLIEISLQNFD
ncbi:hypothetical protein ABPG74_015907 [Tetrahymena malaccensis]